jgi:hypothetical protein
MPAWVLVASLMGVATPSTANQFHSAAQCINGASFDQKCVKAFQHTQAVKYKDFYQTNEEHLLLLDGHGRTVASFQNIKARGEGDFDLYTFEDFTKEIGYFLVNHSQNEGAEYMVVSLASGKAFAMSNVPVISPDLKKLATASCEPEAEVSFEGDNRTQVFAITPQELVSGRVSAVDGCFSNARWRGNTTIDLEGAAPDGSRSFGTLKFRNEKWEFIPAPASH